jgi:hypothetical protein
MRYPIIVLLLVLALIAPTPAPAATVMVYPNGAATVAVPASQYINVFTAGGSSAKVYKQVGYPNMPSSWALETNGTVTNQETIFGPYTNATNIRIEAGNDLVLYSVGSGALAVPVTRVFPGLSPGSGSILRTTARIGTLQPVPTALTTAATMTAAQLLTGIITGTHTAGATQAYTLPTGTLLEAAVPYLQIGEGFEWVLINLSAAAADSITVTAGTDHTIVGDPVVISTHVTTGGAITSRGCSSSTWITKKTAANTFVTYRKN